MAGINFGRVLLGGVLAGLIINLGELVLNFFVVGERYQALVSELGLQPAPSGPAVFVLFGFLNGIVLLWLYAAIRTRFGAGPRTALLAGAAVWFLAWLWPGISIALFLGGFPGDLLLLSLVWSLVEVLLAALAGAAIYTEPAPAL